MQMTLAKALKVRNRVQQKIRHVAGDIQRGNSVLKGAEREDDVSDLMTQYDKLVDYLVNLKSAIFKANEDIQSEIFRLSELKAKVAFLGGIDTTHGKQVNRYSLGGDEVAEFEAVFRKKEIDDLVGRLEQMIDASQEALDHFNHSTLIDIDSPSTVGL